MGYINGVSKIQVLEIRFRTRFTALGYEEFANLYSIFIYSPKKIINLITNEQFTCFKIITFRCKND